MSYETILTESGTAPGETRSKGPDSDKDSFLREAFLFCLV